MTDILSVQLDASAANAFLERLARAPLTPAVLGKIGQGLVASTRDSFFDQRSPDGQAWAPLKPATIKRRRAKGNNSTRILLDTLDMFKTVRASVVGNAVSVQIGTGLPDDRAKYNQEGTSNAPARPFFPADGRLPDVWLARATEPIRDAWRNTPAVR